MLNEDVPLLPSEHTAEAQPVSPRLSALTQAMSSGDSAALDAFLRALRLDGTPISEPTEGDPGYELVTFVWRDRSGANNVCLESPALRQAGIARWLDNQLRKMPGTDIFYRTYRLPRELRASYRFALDAPLIALSDPPDEAVERFSTFMANPAALQADPLNPKSMAEDLGRDTHRVWSLLELPDATPQPWAARRKSIEHGVTRGHRFSSKSLDNERDIFVYTPPGYSKSLGTRSMVLAFDAPHFVPWTLDNLLAEGLIEPTAAVLISNPSLQVRSRELSCYEPFAGFLVGELLPWLAATYNIRADPTHTIVAGFSHGALAASFAAMSHPEVFGNVLSLSGSYWWGPGFQPSRPVQENVDWEWLPRQFEVGPKLPIRFFMTVGLLEVGEVDMLRSNRRMRDTLQAKGYDLSYNEFMGGHDWACWQGLMADGLLALRPGS